MIPLTHWETVLSRQEQFGPAFVTLIRCSAARRRVYVMVRPLIQQAGVGYLKKKLKYIPLLNEQILAF